MTSELTQTDRMRLGPLVRSGGRRQPTGDLLGTDELVSGHALEGARRSHTVAVGALHLGVLRDDRLLAHVCGA